MKLEKLSYSHFFHTRESCKCLLSFLLTEVPHGGPTTESKMQSGCRWLRAVPTGHSHPSLAITCHHSYCSPLDRAQSHLYKPVGVAWVRQKLSLVGSAVNYFRRLGHSSSTTPHHSPAPHPAHISILVLVPQSPLLTYSSWLTHNF